MLADASILPLLSCFLCSFFYYNYVTLKFMEVATRVVRTGTQLSGIETAPEPRGIPALPKGGSTLEKIGAMVMPGG